MSSRIASGRQFNMPKAPKRPRRIKGFTPHEKQRQPREREPQYLGLIAQLPSPISGRWPVEVAHLRYGDASQGKPHTGMAEKPSDRWTLPLTPEEHRLAHDSQHAGSEREFWARHGINPVALCKALYGCKGDLKLMRQIIAKARQMFPANVSCESEDAE